MSDETRDMPRIDVRNPDFAIGKRVDTVITTIGEEASTRLAIRFEDGTALLVDGPELRIQWRTQ
jgi:hypothetical protein